MKSCFVVPVFSVNGVKLHARSVFLKAKKNGKS